MRIQKLEIAGFKSFADRAVLRFGEGITGVVGPNGCGKSNVVDAIRWCMGEMSAKHLRGRAMNDIIFAGCESRGPTGMAEVTLTFANDGDAPPQYASFSEIGVTRRLFRDGTSEYLVNKVPARLRDITDLFLGTGAGVHGFSIIEQGRIGFIVTARPEERRSLIEEVAGITRFKVRKKAAERRMEATEQNLARVNDIIAELDRQLGSLRRQAKKAERYKNLRDELRDLELHSAAAEWLRLTAVEKVQHLSRAKLEDQTADAQRVLAVEEGQLEANRLALVETEQGLQNQQRESAALETQLVALERDIEHWQRQAIEAEQRSTAAKAEVEQSQTALTKGHAERKSLETDARQAELVLGDDDQAIRTAEENVAKVRAEAEALHAEMESIRLTALEHVHSSAQQRTHIANLDRQRKDVHARLDRVRNEHASTATAQSEAEARFAQLDQRRQEVNAQLTSWAERLADLQSRLAEAATAVTQSELLAMAKREELSESRSRLSSLTEIARRYEGYSDGVRALLSADERLPGLLALVTDILEVPPRFEQAIEAALGDRLQYLIVDGTSAAVQAILSLKTHGSGRSGFLPTAARLTRREEAIVPQAGLVGRASECATVKPEYASLGEVLLGNVAIVEDLAAGVRIREQTKTQCTLVTLAGEVLEASGAMVGGATDAGGLLSKQREVRELTSQVEVLNATVEAATAAYEQAEAVHLQIEVDIDQLAKDVHAAEIERAELARDLTAADAERTRLRDHLEVLVNEIAQREEEIDAIDAEQAQAMIEAEAAEAGRAGAEGRLKELQELEQRRAAQLHDGQQDLMHRRVQRAAREEKRAAAQAAMTRLEQTIAELGARIERDLRDISESETLAETLRQQTTEGKARALDLARLAQEGRDKLIAARAHYEAERTRLDGVEQSLRGDRKQREALNESLGQVRMDLQRLEMERARLLEHVSERHDVDLLKIVGDYHMRPLPGAEDEERRQTLDEQIKSMGPINLTAIEERDQVSSRYDFLTHQRDDLRQALDSLKHAITRINRTSRERFKEAFEAVNVMFQQVFPRLFKGGEARLELVESEDLLDAGVEIVVQPPGKKLQNVTLLSGGERALTATALVFAIFLIKPSPFCILDEVDAPLDDVNVSRFNDMLREIAKISQFIVITHNKNTMGEADRLYGITMEERGMSKVVSVDLGARAEKAA